MNFVANTSVESYLSYDCIAFTYKFAAKSHIDNSRTILIKLYLKHIGLLGSVA